ncbi:MAG: hypothetical protein OIF32_00285 [Campylobacterales bacterium]|nr:hypothetical protein [Campylobacterales bacterium]
MPTENKRIDVKILSDLVSIGHVKGHKNLNETLSFLIDYYSASKNFEGEELTVRNILQEVTTIKNLLLDEFGA